MGFHNILHYAHKLIEERVKTGEVVIDATMGGGNDTLFLARLVKENGVVYAFDIQPQALEATRARLSAQDRANCIKTNESDISDGKHDGSGSNMKNGGVCLLLRNHAEMAQAIPTEVHGQIAAIMFNLGYLPGSNHAVITHSDSTLTALDAALTLLKPGGIVTIALYQGHDGAAAEVQAVEQWAEQLEQRHYQALRYQFLNQQNLPPHLIAIEKKQ